ncbi:MAG: NAD-dependent epimerase/dehydratase family protein [Cyclobacteriaceae bacterium]
MSKRIFLTGGTGLVGSFIVHKLLDEGYSVTCSKRETSNMDLCYPFKDQVKWVDMDICDPILVAEHLKEYDWVIHSAALVSFNPRDRNELEEVNVEGTKNVVDACVKNGIKKLLYISSIAALGRGNKKEIDETSEWIDSNINSDYALSKYRAELEVWRGMEEGLEVSVILPSVVLGPGNSNQGSTKLFDIAKKAKKYYPDGQTNIVDVRDVASVVYSIIEKNVMNEHFIVNGGAVSYKEIFKAIAVANELPLPTKRITKTMVLIAYPLLKFYSLIRGKSLFLTSQSIKLIGKEYVYSTKKIKEAIPMEFIDWHETITWTCNQLNKRTSKNV